MQPDSTTPRITGLDGLTADQIERITERLGVRDENDLAFCCRTNRVRDLAGLGADVQAQVQKTLRTACWRAPERTLAHARKAATRVLEALQRDGSALRLAVAGDVRRMERVVREIVLLATAHEPDALRETFVGLPFIADAVEVGPSAVRGALPDGTPVVLEVLPEDPHVFFARWVELTGSPAHWNALVEHAAGLSHRLEPHGLFADDGVPATYHSEPAFYERLGLPTVPPERRGTGWIEKPAEDLIAIRDVRGLVHVHTDAGAGVFPVLEAARRAAHDGFEWMVIADRSPTAFPKGLSVDQLDAQRAAVAAANADPELTVRVFHGVEARVRADERLDWPDAALDLVDVVFGVVEDAPSDDAGWTSVTDRFLAAVNHPRVQVLAHPRLDRIGGTHGPPTWAPLLEAATQTGTLLELSGESHRVALDSGWHAAARRAGCRVLPTADAYDLEGGDNVLCSVGAARRGGWTVPEVVSALSADAFAAWCGDR